MEQDSKIYIAGHRGLVGSAIVGRLRDLGYKNLILKSHQELDLLDSKAAADFFAAEKPEYVFLAAAKVGGIMAMKNYPSEFIYENLVIQNNVIHNAYLNRVKKLLSIGSAGIYPKLSPQPIKEEYIFTGPLDDVIKAYAVAKIAGVVMCQSYNRQYGTNFISAIPNNIYGRSDNFNPENSTVLASLLNKFHQAKIENKKEIVLWGTGKARREFMYVDDLAHACIFLMNNYNDSEIINVGTGTDITIKDLAELIGDLVGFKGEIVWDTSKPEGAMRRLFDVTRLHQLGWRHQVELKEGLEKIYANLENNIR